jgi:hypothetical protein
VSVLKKWTELYRVSRRLESGFVDAVFDQNVRDEDSFDEPAPAT